MTNTQPSERGADVRFPPPLVFLGFILLGLVLRYVIGAIPIAADGWLRVIGIVVFLAGLILMLTAIIDFRRTGQDPAPWTPSPELLEQGPYKWTRNPMYVGFTCVQIGLGLGLGNLWISLMAPIALVIVHFIAVVPEERYLGEKFGSKYQDYRSRVRRYL